MTVRADRFEALFRRGLDELEAERHAGALAVLTPAVRSKPDSGPRNTKSPEEFVCKDAGMYVEAAVRWGSSSDSASKLKELRARMRALLKRSPVCDGSRFADRMEETYRRLCQAAVERQSRANGGRESG